MDDDCDIDEDESGWDDYEVADDDSLLLLSEKLPPKPEKTKDELKIEDTISNMKIKSEGTMQANNRLMKDLKNSFTPAFKKEGFQTSLINDNLYQWQVNISDFPDDCLLYQDLKKLKNLKNQDFITLEMSFTGEYPHKPPFIRVVFPRFAFHTGHVTIGGSICMEVLTSSGWTPSNDIESVLVQIKAEMVGGQARIDFHKLYEYTKEEAKDAFNRVAAQHNWKI